MEEAYSKSDIDHHFENVNTQIAFGFEGVNKRLDTLNGSVKDHTEKLALHSRWQDRAMGGGLVSIALLLPTLGWLLLSVISLQTSVINKASIQAAVYEAIHQIP